MKLLLPTRKWSLFAGAASLCVVLASNAYAITSDSFTYSATKVGYYSISSSAMIFDGFGKAEEDHQNSWSGGLLKNSGTQTRCYNTGVNLPQGATISYLAVWYSGPADSPKLTANLFRQSLGNGSTVLLSSMSATVSPTRAYTNKGIPASVVDNAQYTYMFGVCLPVNGFFSGARIAYTYKNAGD